MLDRKVDWTDWIRGLIAAMVSGGSSAVTSGVAVSTMDPKDYNLLSGKIYILMGLMFGLHAAFGMFLYLKQKPIPDIVVRTKLETTKVTGEPTLTVTTVEKVSTEPHE